MSQQAALNPRERQSCAGKLTPYQTGELMPLKAPGEIPTTLESTDTSVAPNYANETIYIKLPTGFNITNAKHGDTTAGVELLFDGSLDLARKYPDRNGRGQSVWWIDLAMWPHLIHPLCHYLPETTQVASNVARGWNPMIPVRTWAAASSSSTATASSAVTKISLMHNRVLTIQSQDARAQGKVGLLAAGLAKDYPVIQVDENDPRHIGTHWMSEYTVFHLHLICPADAHPQLDIHAVARVAVSMKLLTLEDARDVIKVLTP
jgi:hypothetical protein